jgi:hypothetical protein
MPGLSLLAVLFLNDFIGYLGILDLLSGLLMLFKVELNQGI